MDNQKLEDLLRTIFREKAEKENRLEKIKDIMKGNLLSRCRQLTKFRQLNKQNWRFKGKYQSRQAGQEAIEGGDLGDQ